MTVDLQRLCRYHQHADAFAFRKLVQAHAGLVFATARRITRDAALAEDVSQETFIELARNSGTVTESVGAGLHRLILRKSKKGQVYRFNISGGKFRPLPTSLYRRLNIKT